MRFEWDDEKAVVNLEKHRVSFGEATEVFYDPNALEGEDAEHSLDEARFFIIGYSIKRILYVVFVERHGNVIRIISARPPTPAERKLYEEQEGREIRK
ncbi:MAG TPA: BrnT family toxin [Pyrinomonadaceae bacterium]